MQKRKISEQGSGVEEYQLDDYASLLRYISGLARHKMGYPVSLLTYLGIVDNQPLGIVPDSLANILLNNVGDPFKDSETSLMEVKRHERKIIQLLSKYFGMTDPDSAKGYVTTGGTEGNFAGLWWSKRYLINSALSELIQQNEKIRLQAKNEQELMAMLAKIPNNNWQAKAIHLQKILDAKQAIGETDGIVQQLLTPTIFFTKKHTHYSVPKIAEILRLNTKPVASNDDGSMDLNDFRKEVILHLGAHPHSAIVVVVNAGTTITGAIDDVPAIKKILDESRPKPLYTIHLDGALSGFVLPVVKPFGDIQDYFSSLGINTLSFSAHKYLGLSQPCGIILATRPFFDKAFEKSERSIEYVGNIVDSTVSGSRSGLNVLMFYNAIRVMELDKDCGKLKEMVKKDFETAEYLYTKLCEIYGPEKISWLHHFNVSFPKPSMAIAKKYQLMLTGETATICVLANISHKLIDAFLQDLKAEISNPKIVDLK